MKANLKRALREKYKQEKKAKGGGGYIGATVNTLNRRALAIMASGGGGEGAEEIDLPKNKTFKRIDLENSTFLKMYMQKNATHVGDRENATSVMQNLDYEQITKQKYKNGMVIEEPDFDVE